jgi:hypothetical protein
MVVCPTSKNEVDAFVSVVVSGSNNDPADVAILDQNIDIINEKVYLFSNSFIFESVYETSARFVCDLNACQEGRFTIFGTEVALELRKQGYKGLVFIRSANVSVQDCSAYMSTGGVDACLGKNVNYKDMANMILGFLNDVSR